MFSPLRLTFEDIPPLASASAKPTVKDKPTVSSASSKPTVNDILALAKDPPQDYESRLELYEAARQLMFAVESPQRAEQRVFIDGIQIDLVHTASDMKIFDTLAADPTKTWTVDEFALVCAAEPLLLHRILRYLTSIGLIKELDEGVYIANQATIQLATSGFKSGLVHHTSVTYPSFRALSTHLSSTSYRNPTDPKHTTFHQTHANQDLWQYLSANPSIARSVFEYFAHFRTGFPTWMTVRLPVDDYKLSASDLEKGRVMLCDVGGGSAQQSFGLREAFPELKGHIVVQDTPLMIGMIDQPRARAADIESMEHDILSPQTVKGAKVYYLRGVLHDWDEASCAVILKHIREAMVADSVVIIDEIVIQKTGATYSQTAYDMIMLTTLAAMERTQKQWESLCERVGLRVRDIWIYDKDTYSGLIVCVPV